MVAVVDRRPYRPNRAEWGDLYKMLCGYCARQLHCDICEGMIALKDTGIWPEGGWVSDPGAEVTCLSYEPRGGTKLPRQQLRRLRRTPEAKLPEVCGGCAARRGSEASVSLHTQRDYQAAVRGQTRFECHQPGRKGELCGGWCRAIIRRAAR
jgi:hypothetical protein